MAPGSLFCLGGEGAPVWGSFLGWTKMKRHGDCVTYPSNSQSGPADPPSAKAPSM